MMKNKIAAVIDIGSSVIRMHISQWSNNKITVLDLLEKPTKIGKEVFSVGSISAETARTLSETLSGFCEKAREYGVTSVQAIATTALREASNQAYVLDYILTRNKLNISVLEDSEAGALLIGGMKNNAYACSDNTLLVYGGTGTIDFELLENDETILDYSIQTGLLKITEMIREVSEFSRYTEIMVEEYLDAFLLRKNRVQDLLKASCIVFGSAELMPLGRLFKPNADGIIKVSGKKLLSAYGEHRTLPVAQICRKYTLKTAQGENLYAMLTLLAALLRYTKAKTVVCVQISHGNAMLDSILRYESRKNHANRLYSGALSSALDLAERYHCNVNHGNYVADAALEIFKALKKVSVFNKKQSLLLHIACILHESGHFTNSKNSRKSAFHLIRDAHIYGLCSHETLLIANIVSPRSLPGRSIEKKKNGILSQDDVLLIAKMHAISRIADALDYSHKQKAEITSIILDGDNLIITLQLREDYTLEQWVFNQRLPIFREVFGITPILIIDNIYD
jgi:exopolyphosphatase/guanosine-5'-triphosphate,3'-diphosphate pyrophosphatase